LGVPSGMKQTYPGNIYRGGSWSTACAVINPLKIIC
jgi:hypothetical protein